MLKCSRVNLLLKTGGLVYCSELLSYVWFCFTLWNLILEKWTYKDTNKIMRIDFISLAKRTALQKSDTSIGNLHNMYNIKTFRTTHPCSYNQVTTGYKYKSLYDCFNFDRCIAGSYIYSRHPLFRTPAISNDSLFRTKLSVP